MADDTGLAPKESVNRDPLQLPDGLAVGGFRVSTSIPRVRSPHQALEALNVGIQRKRVNWILDADIRGFENPQTPKTPKTENRKPANPANPVTDEKYPK
jgi:hypothetical protein